EGSISAGARALGLSQPTVSAGIRSLERALAVPLVRRSTRGSALTERGTIIAAWARDVLRASDAFEASVAALRGQRGGHLVVAASMTIAENLIPSWLVEWRRRYQEGGGGDPPPTIELIVRNSEDVMSVVLRHEADIGFVEGSAVLPGLRAQVVAEDELVLVVGSRHPWARRTEPVSAEDLVSGGLVLREKGSGTRQVLEEVLARAGVVLPGDLPQMGSTAAIKSALLEGDSAAVLSVHAVAVEIDRATLHLVPLDGVDLRRRLRAVTRSGDVLEPT